MPSRITPRIFAACIAATLTLMAAAGLAGDSAPADADWAELSAIPASIKEPNGNTDPVGYAQRREQKLLRYRALGLAFYEKYPGDARRWEWLLKTLQTAPSYQLDAKQTVAAEGYRETLRVPVDEAALSKWEALSHSTLIPAALASEQTTDEQKLQVLSADLQARMVQAHLRNEIRQPVDVAGYQQAILDFAQRFPEEENPRWHAGNVFEYGGDWGLNGQSKRSFVAAMQKSPSFGLREMAQGKAHVYSLLDDPKARFELKVKDLNGQTIDFADLRGKVVMIDFWSLTCGSCIDEMPHVKAVYERYRSQGFEVVGIMFNREEEKPKVEALLQKLGIPWRQSLQETRTPDSLWKRFGFNVLGEQFLIDQNGRLVANELNDVSKLEPLIKELLSSSADTRS